MDNTFCIKNIQTFYLDSELLGKTYEINIYTPKAIADAPRKGYPVYFFLDGNASFVVAQELMKAQSIQRERTKVQPGIVVGIDEKSDALFPDGRSSDYTTPAAPEKMVEWFKHRGIPTFDSGGAADFLSFLERDVLDLLKTHYHINQENMTLAGHSLGGFFALYAFTQREHLFAKYVIGSPSLWWNGGEILESLPLKRKKTQVVITIGGNEPQDMKTMCQKVLEQLEDNVLRCSYIEYPNENHLSSHFFMINETFKP